MPKEQQKEIYPFERGERPAYGSTFGRGNFNFISLNLPGYAIQAVQETYQAKKYGRSTEKVQNNLMNRFYQILVTHMCIAVEVLRIRENIIGSKMKKNFQFSLGQNMICGANDIENDEDTIENIWDHFSKSIGFIGIDECITMLYGKKHSEDPWLGEQIGRFMRAWIDQLANGVMVRFKIPWDEINKPEEITMPNGHLRYLLLHPEAEDFDKYLEVCVRQGRELYLADIKRSDGKCKYYINGKEVTPDKANYSLFLTPAESLSSRFTKIDRKKFGKLEDITAKEYYTNSAHVDVADEVTINHKVECEAPWHTLGNAGAISYIESDGLINGNPKAFEGILEIMHDGEMGYSSLNHPIDECAVCHFSGVIPEGEPCPKCGNEDDEYIIRYRRITGYLTTGGAKKWGSGKRAELADRVKHN